MLSQEQRNQILERFAELGSICIEPNVRDRKEGKLSHEITLRRIGIKVKLQLFENEVKFTFENNKECQHLKIQLEANSGNCYLIPDNIRQYYEEKLQSLQKSNWYKERIDARKAQITPIAECDEKIKKLRQSLVFAMSNGSHELFHTNVWSWLIEKDKKFCTVFFERMEGVFECVKREEGNRDLTIWVNKDGLRKAYVVENKFKSIPRPEQLEEYKLGLADSFENGLLVTLQTPENFNVSGWNINTQEKILKKIEWIMSNYDVAMSDVERQMVASYIEMARTLSDVLTKYSGGLGKRWPLVGTAALLEEARLDDIFQKVKAADFVAYIESQNKTKELRKAIEDVKLEDDSRMFLDVSSGFSHKQSLVDFRIVKRRKLESGVWEEMSGIGIQLQGGVYNRCVYTYDTSVTACDIDRSFSKWWLEDDEFLKDGLAANKRICGYATSEYVFRYRGNALTSDEFEDIYKLMVKDVEILVNRIRDREKIFDKLKSE